MQNRSSSNVTFIDVSHWEGNIDWNAVKASGIPAAYAKATEGVNYIDPTFTKNVQAARNANVLLVHTILRAQNKMMQFQRQNIL